MAVIAERDRAVHEQQLTQLIQKGEISFRFGEQYRQSSGFKTLQRLLALQDRRIWATLNLHHIPEDFHFMQDWLPTTGRHPLSAAIVDHSGRRLEVMGGEVSNQCP